MTLPEQVTIYEVGPRDGLQNEKSMVPVDVKEQFVRRLLAAGLPVVEATSFVHPKWVPQLADAEELMTRLGADGKDLPVLVPNERGLDRALELGLRHIAIFGSATETFAQKNLNRSLDEQFAMFEPTVKRARDAGLDVRAYVSMCFGDPWEGAVPVEQVVSVGKRLFDLGASQLSLGDTIGVGTAGQVTTLIDAFVAAGMAKDDLAMHFHDTYGQALANTYSALQSGITTYDASAGGLGGCPYAKSATGNLATEDLVWMLTGLGIEHGVDLDSLVATSAWMAGELGRPSPSAVVRALSQSDDVSSRRVYLHVGAPKTGTTYLQDRLALNAASLRRHGYRYPTGPHSDMFLAALDLLDRPWGGMRPQAEGEWEALVRRARRARGTVVLSHEILAGAKPAEAERALERPVVRRGARRLQRARRGPPGRGRVAGAAQAPAEGDASGPSCGSSARPTSARPTRWFWRVQGLPGVLERWGNGLPPAQVHVVTVPRPGGPPEELWRRFCTALGIDPAWAPLRGRTPQPVDRHRREHAAAPGQRAAQGGRAALRPVPRAGPPARRPRDPGRAAADAAGDAAAGRLRLGRGGRPELDRLGQGRRTSTWSATSRSCARCGPPAGAEWQRPRPAAAARRHLRRRRRDRRAHPRGRAPPRPRRHADLAGRQARAVPPPMSRLSVDAGRARAWAWVAHLRAGGTTPWAAWTATDAVRPRAGYLPGAQQLELLRRLNLAGRPSPTLVERVLAASRARPRPARPRAGRRRRGAPVRPAGRRPRRRCRTTSCCASRPGCSPRTSSPRGARRADADRAEPRRFRTRYELAGDPWLAAAYTAAAGRRRPAARRRRPRRCTCSAPTWPRCWRTPGRPAAFGAGAPELAGLPGPGAGPAAAAAPGRPARGGRAVPRPAAHRPGRRGARPRRAARPGRRTPPRRRCPTCPPTPPSWPARSAPR